VTRGWSAALCGYTLAPEASLTQIANELKSAFDWLGATAREHGIQGPIIVTGWSAGPTAPVAVVRTPGAILSPADRFGPAPERGHKA
jgi:acetyl esterase/lipase